MAFLNNILSHVRRILRLVQGLIAKSSVMNVFEGELGLRFLHKLKLIATVLLSAFYKFFSPFSNWMRLRHTCFNLDMLHANWHSISNFNS